MAKAKRADIEVSKDGPTAQRRKVGDLEYLIEAGPDNRGTVGHFRARQDSILRKLYERGTIGYEQYQAGAQWESLWAISGLGGRPQTGRMERTDGHKPIAPEHVLKAKEEIFTAGWWIGQTKQKLLERMLGHGMTFTEAAAQTVHDGVGYERYGRDGARKRMQEALLKLAVQWKYLTPRKSYR